MKKLSNLLRREPKERHCFERQRPEKSELAKNSQFGDKLSNRENVGGADGQYLGFEFFRLQCGAIEDQLIPRLVFVLVDKLV